VWWANRSAEYSTEVKVCGELTAQLSIVLRLKRVVS
jgi:hypothetical protein